MASASLSFALTGDTEEANTSHQHFILHWAGVSQVVWVLHGSCRKPQPGSSMCPVFPDPGLYQGGGCGRWVFWLSCCALLGLPRVGMMHSCLARGE